MGTIRSGETDEGVRDTQQPDEDAGGDRTRASTQAGELRKLDIYKRKFYKGRPVSDIQYETKPKELLMVGIKAGTWMDMDDRLKAFLNQPLPEGPEPQTDAQLKIGALTDASNPRNVDKSIECPRRRGDDFYYIYGVEITTYIC